jgi:AraC-like DNA-binding protein
MIGHRLKAVLPVPTGTPAVAVLAYGLEERMRPAIIDRPRGTDSWLLMGFATPARLWPDGPGRSAGPTSRAAAAGGARPAAPRPTTRSHARPAAPAPAHAIDAALADDDGNGVPLPADSLVLWRPDAPHRYGHPTEPWRHSWLHLDGEHVRRAAATLGLPLEAVIPNVPTAWLDACILGIHDELTANARPDGDILAAHLDILLRRAARVAAGDAQVPAGLLAVRTHIEARFAEPLRLAALARLAGCSIPHLCAGFREHFAVSPIDLAIRLRLAHARRLMSERGMTVAAAAEQVGYADYRHFTRLFRRQYGHPPRASKRGA